MMVWNVQRHLQAIFEEAEASDILALLAKTNTEMIELLSSYYFHCSNVLLISDQALRQSPNNYLSRTWWNRIFNFLENNVQTTVPVVFECPVALPSCCRQRYRMVEGARDEWGQRGDNWTEVMETASVLPDANGQKDGDNEGGACLLETSISISLSWLLRKMTRRRLCRYVYIIMITWYLSVPEQ